MAEELSPQLLAYIHRHCPTMDHVEVILALLSAGTESRALANVAQETRLATETVQRVVDELSSTRAIVGDADGYRLDGDSSDPLAGKELLLMYHTRPVALVRAIYSRHSPIQSFADAFKLRRKDES
jgi:hypothetical protein